jgi:hypothetical protein
MNLKQKCHKDEDENEVFDDMKVKDEEDENECECLVFDEEWKN